MRPSTAGIAVARSRQTSHDVRSQPLIATANASDRSALLGREDGQRSKAIWWRTILQPCTDAIETCTLEPNLQQLDICLRTAPCLGWKRLDP